MPHIVIHDVQRMCVPYELGARLLRSEYNLEQPIGIVCHANNRDVEFFQPPQDGQEILHEAYLPPKPGRSLAASWEHIAALEERVTKLEALAPKTMTTDELFRQKDDV
jgi:hypothetical protein